MLFLCPSPHGSRLVSFQHMVCMYIQSSAIRGRREEPTFYLHMQTSRRNLAREKNKLEIFFASSLVLQHLSCSLLRCIVYCELCCLDVFSIGKCSNFTPSLFNFLFQIETYQKQRRALLCQLCLTIIKTLSFSFVVWRWLPEHVGLLWFP